MNFVSVGAYCQNGEVPVGFWKCEDLQADVDDVDDGINEDGDDWSILTGVGYLIEPRHAACHCSHIWPSAFLYLEAAFISVALCIITYKVIDVDVTYGLKYTNSYMPLNITVYC